MTLPDPIPPPVCVELLGPLRLLVGGEPVEVPGAKRRAVLAQLALAEGQPVSAQVLAATVRTGGVGVGDLGGLGDAGASAAGPTRSSATAR